MATERELNKQAVIELLDRAQRVVGLDLVFKDIQGSPSVPTPWTHHRTVACREMKKTGEAKCIEFMFHHIRREMRSRPEGRIHRCPHGLTEIVVPAVRLGLVEGFLFGGQCWMDETAPPCEGLIVRPTEEWLEDRHVMLRCLADAIAQIMGRKASSDPHADKIESFIQHYFQEKITIVDLACEIHLSPSRAAHVVKERFGISFSTLLNSFRLAQAAEMLRVTKLSVGEIAVLVGIEDQGYLARLFRRKYRMSPLSWRKMGATLDDDGHRDR